MGYRWGVPLNTKLLSIYLNDHWAGSTVGRELARRAAGENRGNDFGAALERLLAEIEEDRRVLREVMRSVGAAEDRLKTLAARAGERAGRLKPNGSLRGYSPLSRLVELEGLTVGVEGKLSLWQALAALEDPALAQFDFAALQARAEAQLERLEQLRLEAARVALREA